LEMEKGEYVKQDNSSNLTGSHAEPGN
jgi:hypothetical protein